MKEGFQQKLSTFSVSNGSYSVCQNLCVFDCLSFLDQQRTPALQMCNFPFAMALDVR